MLDNENLPIWVAIAIALGGAFFKYFEKIVEFFKTLHENRKKRNEDFFLKEITDLEAANKSLKDKNIALKKELEERSIKERNSTYECRELRKSMQLYASVLKSLKLENTTANDIIKLMENEKNVNITPAET